MTLIFYWSYKNLNPKTTAYVVIFFYRRRQHPRWYGLETNLILCNTLNGVATELRMPCKQEIESILGYSNFMQGQTSRYLL